MEWFANEFTSGNKTLRVLDIGSYDVNGSYRDIFESLGHSYTGLDMEAGPNVDLAPVNPYTWEEVETESYDVVISGQALEHIEFFWVTLSEIVRVTKQNGTICIIAPNGFGEHRYPVDCWRFFTDGMVALARYYELEIVHAHTNAAPSANHTEWFSKECSDSMLIARKPYAGRARIIDLTNYRCIPADHSRLTDAFVSYEQYLQASVDDTTGSEIDSGQCQIPAITTQAQPEGIQKSSRALARIRNLTMKLLGRVD